MEEILEAIADSVANLVLALVDSETQGNVFGDMTPAAKLIQTAALGVAEAGTDLMKITFEELKVRSFSFIIVFATLY